jgi:hypothetical protein
MRGFSEINFSEWKDRFHYLNKEYAANGNVTEEKFLIIGFVRDREIIYRYNSYNR